MKMTIKEYWKNFKKEFYPEEEKRKDTVDRTSYHYLLQTRVAENPAIANDYQKYLEVKKKKETKKKIYKGIETYDEPTEAPEISKDIRDLKIGDKTYSVDISQAWKTIKTMDDIIDKNISIMENAVLENNEEGVKQIFGETSKIAKMLSYHSAMLSHANETDLQEIVGPEYKDLKNYMNANGFLNANMASILKDLAFGKVIYSDDGETRYASTDGITIGGKKILGMYVDNEGILSGKFNGSFMPLQLISKRALDGQTFDIDIPVRQAFDTTISTDEDTQKKTVTVYIDKKPVFTYEQGSKNSEQKTLDIEGYKYDIARNKDSVTITKHVPAMKYGTHKEILGSDGIIYHHFKTPNEDYFKKITIDDILTDSLKNIGGKTFQECDAFPIEENSSNIKIDYRKLHQAYVMAVSQGYDTNLLEESVELATNSSTVTYEYKYQHINDINSKVKQAVDWNKSFIYQL